MKDLFVQLSFESLIPRIPIYTIGYGGRSIEQFIELLKKYEIEYLIDVRSQPYSRFNKQFSKDVLTKILREHSIGYVFMGDTLGGRPKDDSCYADGRVDYSKVREKLFFQQGINRLQTAWEKQIPSALMCAEMKPQECHRSKLIGNTLCDQNIEVAHIDETGNLKKQLEVNKLLLDDQLPLFENQEPSIILNDNINFSRKKYILPSERLL
jgi:uncharacterized protein (DUF488 family)